MAWLLSYWKGALSVNFRNVVGWNNINYKRKVRKYTWLNCLIKIKIHIYSSWMSYLSIYLVNKTYLQSKNSLNAFIVINRETQRGKNKSDPYTSPAKLEKDRMEHWFQLWYIYLVSSSWTICNAILFAVLNLCLYLTV